MSYHDQLLQELDALIHDVMARGDVVKPQWVTHEICDRHRPALVDGSEHADFWTHCGYTYTRKLATERVNKLVGATSADPEHQIHLPGFERRELQDYYVVTRDGEDVAVCVINLTDEEIDQKVALYMRQAQAATDHARELQRFKLWREALRNKFETASGQ